MILKLERALIRGQVLWGACESLIPSSSRSLSPFSSGSIEYIDDKLRRYVTRLSVSRLSEILVLSSKIDYIVYVIYGMLHTVCDIPFQVQVVRDYEKSDVRKTYRDQNDFYSLIYTKMILSSSNDIG